MTAHNQVDLTNCDREPIHIPGSIQPHGCLLACDAVASQVLRHSANAGAMLDFEVDPNGQTLGALVGDAAAHDIRNALARTPEGRGDGRDARVASQGESRGAPGHANTGTHANLATQALQDVTNDMAGISGEHIADFKLSK